MEEEEEEVFNIDEWKPRTKIGQLVKEKRITRIEEIFAAGKPIKEAEIINALLPNLESNVLEITSVQRMTKNNRKQKYMVTAVVGDRNGHVGVSSGKNEEVKPAISIAIKNAKSKIISVNLGCGSWECNCGTAHSLPMTVRGKCGGVEVILKPAPRGVGVVAGEVVKKVLEAAGIKDVWSFAKGRTRNVYNTAMATYRALEKISKIKNVEEIKVPSQEKSA